MGPSRKRARTKPPSVAEESNPPPIVADPTTTTKQTTPVAYTPRDVVDKEEDVPTSLKSAKPDSTLSRQVRYPLESSIYLKAGY